MGNKGASQKVNVPFTHDGNEHTWDCKMEDKFAKCSLQASDIQYHLKYEGKSIEIQLNFDLKSLSDKDYTLDLHLMETTMKAFHDRNDISKYTFYNNFINKICEVMPLSDEKTNEQEASPPHVGSKDSRLAQGLADNNSISILSLDDYSNKPAIDPSDEKKDDSPNRIEKGSKRGDNPQSKRRQSKTSSSRTATAPNARRPKRKERVGDLTRRVSTPPARSKSPASPVKRAKSNKNPVNPRNGRTPKKPKHTDKSKQLSQNGFNYREIMIGKKLCRNSPININSGNRPGLFDIVWGAEAATMTTNPHEWCRCDSKEPLKWHFATERGKFGFSVSFEKKHSADATCFFQSLKNIVSRDAIDRLGKDFIWGAKPEDGNQV